MSALVKKEIRLIWPAWLVALLLSVVQAITRPYDFYVATLLFLGLTMMALSSIGREASLNTFSNLLAQPAERTRLWRIKLSVLAAAFLSVLGVWFLAFIWAFATSSRDANDVENSYNLFITVCLIATATFTGGLWTTLLLRQLAGAFWLTLLVPATLSGFTAAFTAPSQSDNGVIAFLCVIIALYSVGGFFFARWLFFRAQDVGWSGGTIVLPEWKFWSDRAEGAGQIRQQRPLFALLKKEILLQQGVLTGAAGLLVLHVSIVLVRVFHKFPMDSAGEILTSVFWLLWLVLPALLGSTAVAEERKLGIAESQFCLPVSRRGQFAIKALVTLCLGCVLGALMPVLIETLASALGAANPIFAKNGDLIQSALRWIILGVAAFLTLVSFFASSLAKNFLQAIGFAIVTFLVFTTFVPLFSNNQTFYSDSIAPHSILPLLIAIPTVPFTLLWLAWLNYRDFREGWPLWRRSLLGAFGAIAFVILGSAALYHRAWEAFEPAEPAHGAPILSLVHPPKLSREGFNNFLVQLPDGRVWFDFLSHNPAYEEEIQKWDVLRWLLNPLPSSAGPHAFIAGSNWVSMSAWHVDEYIQPAPNGSTPSVHVVDYADTVGIQRDGTLWVSAASTNWNGNRLTQFGAETNWQQLVRPLNSIAAIILLKKDGTLWEWGTNRLDWQTWPQKWPGLTAFQPRQIGVNSNWTELYSWNFAIARKSDGSFWNILRSDKTGEFKPSRDAMDGRILSQKYYAYSPHGDMTAYIRKDGTLWVVGQYLTYPPTTKMFQNLETSAETNWVSVAISLNWMVALKSDGTLWQWNRDWRSPFGFTIQPLRLGIHDDCVAIVGIEGGMVSLAADGSLWFWPNPSDYNYTGALIRLPKQPEFLGNLFGSSN